MKTLRTLLSEKRSNPSLNPTLTAYEQLKKYKGKGVYITFTSVNKVGINPNNKFKTPTAIYTYPLDGVWHHMKKFKDASNVPFAGKADHIAILKPRGNFIQDISKTYTKDMYDKDLAKLRKMYPQKDPYEIGIEWSIQEGAQRSFNRSWGGKMWNITRYVSYNHNLKGADNTVHKWNKIWRNLGYDGIGDTSGIIHYNEPVQAIFLSIKGINHIETIMNRSSKKDFVE